MLIDIEFYISDNGLVFTRMSHNGVTHVTADNRFPNKYTKQKDEGCYFVLSSITKSINIDVDELVDSGVYRKETHSVDCDVRYNDKIHFHYVEPRKLPQTIIDII